MSDNARRTPSGRTYTLPSEYLIIHTDPAESIFTTTTPISTTTLAPTSAVAPTPTPTPKCRSQQCSQPECPPCPSGQTCTLTVIDSSCQCPVASCVKVDFEPGIAKPQDVINDAPRSKSVVAPVLGSIVGILLIVAVASFFVLRHRRQRRMANEHLFDQEGQTGGSTEYTHGKVELNDDVPSAGGWQGSVNDAKRQNDAVRVHYPDPPRLPELAELGLGGAPQARFAGRQGGRRRHTSLISTLSTGILDEAVKMVMNKKATPKVMRLNMVKASNGDMIQRSNSLHSNNSVQRTASQRRVMDAKSKSKGRSAQGVPGDKAELPEPGLTSEEIEEPVSTDTQLSSGVLRFTPAVMVTAPSARSSVMSNGRNGRLPNMVLESRPLHPDYHVRRSSSSRSRRGQSSAVAVPELDQSSTSTLSPPTATTAEVLSTSTPNAATQAPIPIVIEPSSDNSVDLQSPPASSGSGVSLPSFIFQDPNGHKMYSSGVPQDLRTSTFSTSDLRSVRSTISRGSGEEITIFWDGKRDSNVNP
ncbi:hypothetical protein B0O80DRAFT_436499 [Mortierella sp. GBAus27b]|nr:hypothetical protein B0O80DRAFT_436499 [Mortierella sp. GBAus27b]